MLNILLGPILIAIDSAPENMREGVALCVVLIPAMACVLFSRRKWCVSVSVTALLLWLFFGIIGLGIGC